MGIPNKTAQVSNAKLIPPLRQFGGINTRDARTAIKDNEFSFLENVMPIGDGNLKVVPGVGATEASIPGAATTIIYARYFTINGGDFSFIATADGRLFQLAHASNTLTLISGATVFTTPTIDQWKSERIVIIDPTRGYYDWNGTTLTLISAGVTGTTIAVYAGRVFIANGRTVQFTDANSYNSFAGAGGSFILTEGVLRQSVSALEPSNNFLYIIGDSAVYALGDLQVSGGVTFFSLVNLATDTGTSFRTCAATLDKALTLVDTHGVAALLGAQPKRLSAALDGIYPSIDFTAAPCSAVTQLFNIHGLFILFPAFNDSGTIRSIIATFFDGKWFFISHSVDLKFIWSATRSKTDVLYGTDGTNIFRLLNDATNPVAIKIKTKLFDWQNPYVTKQMVRVGVEAEASVVNSISVSVDTLNTSAVLTTFVFANSIQWRNNAGNIVGWQNNSTQPITWFSGGSFIAQGNAEGGGKYVGFTLSGLAAGLTIKGILGEYNEAERW
jgi:hypothetical protein